MKLRNGSEFPVLGLGCYQSWGEDAYRAVRTALDAGYRHIDTAEFYQNEEQVGRAMRDSGVPREEIFLVTKLWPLSFAHAEQALDASLAKLDTDYVDAYLLHWPGTDETLRNSAYEAALCAAQRGKVKCAGVSNFLRHHLEALSGRFDAPQINQVELHPWFQQRGLTEYCRQSGIAVTVWRPLNRGVQPGAETLQEIGAAHGKTACQTILRWHIEKGHAAIPKSVHRERILENFNVFDFALSKEETARIDALDAGLSAGKNPDTFDGIC